MGKRSYNPAHFAILISLFCGALLFATGAQAQIAKVPNDDGRILFVNAEPPPPLHLTPRRAASMLETTAKRSIYLPPETSFTGKNRPGMNLDRDGAEKLVREAAERHGVPSFRETRNYVQRVQSAYFRPGSGRLDGAFINPRAIRKATDPAGRTIFTND